MYNWSLTTISVIIPAYNAERTILATIESVQQQTFKDLEIIVINDGSSDRTLELLATVTDQRLKIYSYCNGGLSTARNRGIARAQGEYISFIDADDLWTPDKLEKQLAALQVNSQASVAYSWLAVMLETENNTEDNNVTFAGGTKVAFTGDVYSPLLLENFIGNGSNILAKSEAIKSVGEFDPSFKSCEDWDYYLRLAAQYHFALVREHQIIYRKTTGTLSTNGLVMETEGLRLINKAYQTAPKKLQQQKNKTIAKFSLLCGKIYFDRSSNPGDIIKARQRLFKAIKLNPLIVFSQDTYILLFKVLLRQLFPAKVVRGLISILKKPFAIKLVK